MWEAVRLLGSLKIAVLLFLVLVVACAVGTLVESRFDARVARYYVYDAPWFLIWLVVLCVNLAAAAASRWPWRKRHTGFITVHAGIILLLIGAMVGMTWGIEGSITLNVGREPRSWMIVREMALSFTDPASGHPYRADLPVDLRPPSPGSPAVRVAPSGAARYVFERYSEELLEEKVAVALPGGAPAVNLRLSSGMMGQSLEPALFAFPEEARAHDLMGLATIRIVDALEPPPVSGVRRPQLQVKVNPDGTVAWRAWSSRGEPTEGVAPIGGTFAAGWADWQVEIVGAFNQATAEPRIVEHAGNVLPMQASRMRAGVYGWVELADGTRSTPQWFVAGQQHPVKIGEVETFVAFGYRTEPLGFTVLLESFEVPRDEGTDSPANYRSTLVFRDLATGETARDWCGMNRPALFPAGFHRHFTGMTYKFSQASWNPQDLSESTVQVLYDPGWMLKWIGSLVITAGLFIIFYGGAWRTRRPEDTVNEAPRA